MSRTRSAAAPDGIEEVRRRIEEWRRAPRSAGRRRIPELLWRAAVEVARCEGLYRTARALRLNYQTLKDRLEGSARGAGVRREDPAFVEVMSPMAASGAECVVEVADGSGATMRVHFKGVAGPVELAALARWFWRVER